MSYEVVPIWILYSFLAAFFLAVSDLLTKKYNAEIRDLNLTCARVFFSLPVLWVFSIIEGVPVIDGRIIWVYAIGLPLELLATILYVKALRLSPLSVTVPFLAFTPAFLLITSPIMLGEFPAKVGVIGVILIVLGAYTLNFRSIQKGFLYPFKMIITEKGSLLMLIVAFLFSINSNFGKLGVHYSSPSFLGASFFTLMALFLFVFILIKGEIASIFKKELAIIGFFSALMITFHLLALKLIFVSYMISIKRSSLLMSIVLGYLFLQERDIKEKFLGGVLMIAGIIVITFMG